jgi:AraC-like DNA-binding protein
MWSSKIVESADPDEFIRFIRPNGCKILVTERGSFEARGIFIDVDRLYLQRRRERLARLVEVDMLRAGIVFLTEPGPSMFWNGAEIGPDNLALFAPGSRYFSRLSGPTSWGSLSLACEDMESVWARYFGSSPTWTTHCTVITPSPSALANLRSLHAAAGDMAEASSNSSMSRPLSAHALEQSLIDAMLECIDTPSVRAETTAMQHHRLIIRRFCEKLEQHPAKPLHVPETSHTIGVSGRTLRTACHEQLGVSPTQYLLLRRMNLARRTLQHSDPDVTTVTDVATDLGFWELGRFSVKYRQIFGETPSATLRASGPRKVTFQDYGATLACDRGSTALPQHPT